MNELQVSLMSDEDLTVIAADTFHGKKPKDFVEEVKIDLEQPLSQYVDRNDKYEDSTPLKPRLMERPMTPTSAVESSRGFFCTSGDVFDAVIPLSAGSSSTRRQTHALPHTSESPAIVAALARANSHGSSSTAESTPTRLFPSASVSNPSPTALRAGARAWREMHGQPAAGDFFGGIDFRTGMSGHSALTSASSHPHDYLNSHSRTSFRGFSNHSGLTLWKTGRKSTSRGPPPNSSLVMPMHPGTHHEVGSLPETSWAGRND
jgi:hypothetical protein